MHSCLSFFSSLRVANKWNGERSSRAWTGKQLVGGGAPSELMGQWLTCQLSLSTVSEKAPPSCWSHYATATVHPSSCPIRLHGIYEQGQKKQDYCNYGLLSFPEARSKGLGTLRLWWLREHWDWSQEAWILAWILALCDLRQVIFTLLAQFAHTEDKRTGIE